MKINFKQLTLVIGLATIAFSANVSAQEIKPISDLSVDLPREIAQAKPMKRGNGDGFPDGGRLWSRLNLTTTQQNQMQTIKQKYQPEMSTLREQIETERQKLATMMQNNQSEANLRSQHQKIISLDQKIHNLRFESMLEMRNVLTPEQRQEFRQLMNERQVNRQRRLER